MKRVIESGRVNRYAVKLEYSEKTNGSNTTSATISNAGSRNREGQERRMKDRLASYLTRPASCMIANTLLAASKSACWPDCSPISAFCDSGKMALEASLH